MYVCMYIYIYICINLAAPSPRRALGVRQRAPPSRKFAPRKAFRERQSPPALRIPSRANFREIGLRGTSSFELG